MIEKKSSNSLLLRGLCVVLPSALLVAAHYFPWRKVRGRELHQLEVYVVGTSAIVGTAGVAIALSEGDNGEHVTLLSMAAGSAGVITLAAHAVDEFVKGRARVANLESQLEALKNGPDIR